jgi:hypothetical protein
MTVMLTVQLRLNDLLKKHRENRTETTPPEFREAVESFNADLADVSTMKTSSMGYPLDCLPKAATNTAGAKAVVEVGQAQLAIHLVVTDSMFPQAENNGIGKKVGSCVFCCRAVHTSACPTFIGGSPFDCATVVAFNTARRQTDFCTYPASGDGLESCSCQPGNRTRR